MKDEDIRIEFGNMCFNERIPVDTMRRIVEGEVSFTLDATCPEVLLTCTTPDGVWLRNEGAFRWDLITVSGRRKAVLAFIADHWGAEEVERLEEEEVGR